MPPLLRAGMKLFASTKLSSAPSSSLKTYSHDEEWSEALFATPAACFFKELDAFDYVIVTPGEVRWSAQIFGKDDDWLNAQLSRLVDLTTTIETQPPGLEVPDFFVRRHAAMIAVGLGVGVLALLVAAGVFLWMTTR
ncbi:MAG: hypothetical protein GY822_20030 [Deltaproteobacteria bacterium]|nr:hypothetical protein [Deltaproteobacteria bacterium]